MKGEFRFLGPDGLYVSVTPGAKTPDNGQPVNDAMVHIEQFHGRASEGRHLVDLELRMSQFRAMVLAVDPPPAAVVTAEEPPPGPPASPRIDPTVTIQEFAAFFGLQPGDTVLIGEGGNVLIPPAPIAMGPGGEPAITIADEPQEEVLYGGPFGQGHTVSLDRRDGSLTVTPGEAQETVVEKREDGSVTVLTRPVVSIPARGPEDPGFADEAGPGDRLDVAAHMSDPEALAK